jgi:hypothetical protein
LVDQIHIGIVNPGGIGILISGHWSYQSGPIVLWAAP